MITDINLALFFHFRDGYVKFSKKEFGQKNTETQEGEADNQTGRPSTDGINSFELKAMERTKIV